MREKIRLILIDIDDCLIPTENQETENFGIGIDKIREYVKMANEGRFPTIAFCTGRDRNYVEAVSFVAGRPNSWSIIESGIALFNPTTKDMPLNPALTLEVEKTFMRIRQERLPKILEKFSGLFDYPGNRINIALERQHGVDISIEECYEVVKQELKELESQGIIIIHHSKIAVDISPQGIDKASGVRFLAEKAGIDLSAILGIGDSRGDFPMLRLVGQVGCPANSSDECKELIKNKGGYISPYKHAFGVADILSHFTEEKG